jgi:hypothetical protein
LANGPGIAFGGLHGSDTWREIAQGEHNFRGAHILFEVPAFLTRLTWPRWASWRHGRLCDVVQVPIDERCIQGFDDGADNWSISRPSLDGSGGAQV